MAAATTRNPFVPAIVRFSEYLQSHMQQQGQLTERMYAFNREEKIKNLSAFYSESLNKARDPGEVAQTYAEGIAESFRQGVPEVAQLIGQSANVKISVLDYQQKREFAQNTLNILGAQLKGIKFQYGDDQIEFDKIIGQLPADPLQALNIAENIIKTGKLQKKTSVGISPSRGIVGGTFTEDQWGNQSNYQPFINAGGTVYEDRGIIGKVDKADTLASPEVQAQFSKLRTNLIESQRPREQRLSRIQAVNNKTGEVKDVLLDQSGRIFNIEKGEKGSLITSEDWVEHGRHTYEKTISAASVNLSGSKFRNERQLLNQALAPIYEKGKYVNSKGETVDISKYIEEGRTGGKFLGDYHLREMMDELEKREEKEKEGSWSENPLNKAQRDALKLYKESYKPALNEWGKNYTQHISQYGSALGELETPENFFERDPGLPEGMEIFMINPNTGDTIYKAIINGKIYTGLREELEKSLAGKR